MNSQANELSQYGIDYADAMERFGENDALFRRLAIKYLDDDHLNGLIAAMESQDYEAAYKNAHSLKGVAGNLSLKRLYDIASMICKDLREGEPQAAERLLPDASAAHQQAITGLAKIKAGEL